MNAQSAYGLENVSIQGAYGSTGLLDMAPLHVLSLRDVHPNGKS